MISVPQVATGTLFHAAHAALAAAAAAMTPKFDFWNPESPRDFRLEVVNLPT
jgi:hypothetical protein